MNRNQRITAIVAAVAIVLSLLLIVRFTVRSGMFKGGAQEVNTPGWKIANELTPKLNEDHAFLDVGFNVVTETPLKFEVVGAVYSPQDMEKLKARLKELRPEEDYELKVELMKK